MLLERIQLDADERVLLQVRRHWFILTVRLLSPVLLALLPLIALPFLQSSAVASPVLTTLSQSTEHAFLTQLYLIWLLIMWIFAFSIWTNYYLDVLTITNERIVLVDQEGLFSRTVASFRLERMQDIYVGVHGIFATLLDFGTIHAETASDTEEEFQAHYIPKPRDVKATILQASDTLLNRRYQGTQT